MPTAHQGGSVMTKKIQAVENKGFSIWLQHTDLGQYLFAQEQNFFQAVLAGRQPESILLLGYPTVLFKFKQTKAATIRQAPYGKANADVLAQNTHPPWPDGSLDCIAAAHWCEEDGQEFATIPHRLLKPNGCLIITGFNPYSLWRFRSHGMPPQIRRGLSLAKLKKQLADENCWRIEEGRFINYLPPVQSVESIRFWHFMEQAGNRWWPHRAAVYGLVLTKQVLPLDPVRNSQTAPDFGREPALGLARQKTD